MLLTMKYTRKIHEIYAPPFIQASKLWALPYLWQPSELVATWGTNFACSNQE